MHHLYQKPKEYSYDVLEALYEDKEEIQLYLNLLNPDLIKESLNSNVILETPTDGAKCRDPAYAVIYKTFAESLKDCTSIESADALSIKFGEINTVKTRKLLVKDIVDFKTDYHLTSKFLCRILANIEQKYKSEKHDIRKHLEIKLQQDYDAFKVSTTRQNNPLFDNRIRNITFVIELTKLRVLHPPFLLQMIRQ